MASTLHLSDPRRIQLLDTSFLVLASRLVYFQYGGKRSALFPDSSDCKISGLGGGASMLILLCTRCLSQ